MQSSERSFFRYVGQIIHTAKTPRIVRASLKTALVVGLILNAINQGGAIIEGVPLSISHLLMNFLVPFCVSSYSAARNELSRMEKEAEQFKDQAGRRSFS